MNAPRIIKTNDGSHTLYREDLDETYHSLKGAVTESEHVFLKSGLERWFEVHPEASTANVLEVGFGSGLNAALTARFSRLYDKKIDYCALEPFPLDGDVISKINYFEDDPEMRAHFLQLHQSPWHEPLQLDGFTLHKIKAGILQFSPNRLFDVVYFDAFAPEKQPEMWAPEVLRRVFELMNSGGILTTYCAKGQFRRDLKGVGFAVKKLAGPPNGKREMTRGEKA